MQRELQPDQQRVEVDALVEAVSREAEPERGAVREREVDGEREPDQQSGGGRRRDVAAEPRGQPEHGDEEHDPDGQLRDLDRVAERNRVRDDGAVEEAAIPRRGRGRHVP